MRGQFKHLSSLTALQRLEIACSNTEGLAQALSGIADLSTLTHLELKSSALPLSAASTRRLAELTALESLTLHGCAVQPVALAAFTHLRALRLIKVQPLPRATPQDLVSAVSELQLLTELHAAWCLPPRMAAPQPDAFTALTASTDLRALQMTQLPTERKIYGGPLQLFKPDTLYPQLQLIDLAHTGSCNLRLSPPQLELLCSCCPGVRSLGFALSKETSAAACLPLLQLTALTCLQVCGLDTLLAAAAAVEAVAQLTGLQQLSLSHLNQLREKLTDYSLVKLTALTALTDLQLKGRISGACQHMRNTARCGKDPDVWEQLLRFLLRDATCRKALRKLNTGPAATPAEAMRRQIASKVAEELAATPPAEGQEQAKATPPRPPASAIALG